MEDIQFQFNQLIKAIIQFFPSKDKLTEMLKNPIQLKIMKLTVSVGLIVMGLIFMMCYMAGVSRTQSLNPFHAFAFRYYPFYLIGLGITYLAYRISYYFLNDVADGDKLTPNGEKGNSEWMMQDEETFSLYDLVLTDELNSEWCDEQESNKEIIELASEPSVVTVPSCYQPLKLKSQKLSRMKYIEYLEKESEEKEL